MDANKKTLLESQGWTVGSADEFLNLSNVEIAYLEMKLALSQKLKQLRLERNLTQHEVAQLIGSSQSRVAKIESGDSSVTLDLQVRSLLALGASRQDLAETIQA
jgi:DNA-binding XRE family transcriptional regulator